MYGKTTNYKRETAFQETPGAGEGSKGNRGLCQKHLYADKTRECYWINSGDYTTHNNFNPVDDQGGVSFMEAENLGKFNLKENTK